MRHSILYLIGNHGEHACIKHVQLDKLSFSNRFIVYVWTGENDAETLRVDVNFFRKGEKKLRFQMKTDTCGQGLNLVVQNPRVLNEKV